MYIRSLDWRDLPQIYKYREKATYFDSAFFATQGSNLITSIYLNRLTAVPATFVYVVDNGAGGEQKLVGQFSLAAGSMTANISFLAPSTEPHGTAGSLLLDTMTKDAGNRGACHIVAEVEESSRYFEAFRHVGYVALTRQELWKINLKEWYRGFDKSREREEWEKGNWDYYHNDDILESQSLYSRNVPEMVQQVEPLKAVKKGLVCRCEGKLTGFSDIRRGRNGVWLRPIIEKNMADSDNFLLCLLNALKATGEGDAYFAIRGYQSWLGSQLETQGGVLVAQHVVMVKHLAVKQTYKRPFGIPNMERQPEITTPIANANGD